MAPLTQMFAVAVFLLFQTASTRAEKREAIYQIHEDYTLDETPIAQKKSDSMMSCSRLCNRDERCYSANFIKSRKTCLLLNETLETHPKHFLKKANVIHLTKMNVLGSKQELAARSCKSFSSAIYPSGTYWIDPDGGSHDNAFKVYCDTETDGGGWTLMWSYTFTNYDNFWTQRNAVTPIPNWQGFDDWVNVPVSTVPPLNETDYNARDFQQWKQFGKEFLIKSNINNWMACAPGTGSLVDLQGGSVVCKIVKRVTDTCSDAPPPSGLGKSSICGPTIKGGGGSSAYYYYFDGCTRNNMPVHSPCGRYEDNGLKNVENPHGNIFVR